MKWLVSADLHLTDRPRDQYRFALFPWLLKQQQCHGVDATFILGDLTDRKDGHSAVLVNRIINELVQLKPPVYLLKGNHDYLDPKCPFFKFLGMIPGVKFISSPRYVRSLGVAFIPHQSDQAAFDQACDIIPQDTTAVFTHNAFQGAIAETGAPLSGLRWPGVESKHCALWYSGDIHRPQAVTSGPLYVGAPYPIRFGEDYAHRVVLIEDWVATDLYFPSLRKHTVQIGHAEEITNNDRLKSGDHIKVIVTLTREEVVEWANRKQAVMAACKRRGLEVFGVEVDVLGGDPKRISVTTAPGRLPHDVFEQFCKHEKIPAAVKRAGTEILD